MPTKQQIADTLKGRLSEVADRGRLFGQALKVRADMAALRRRLRVAYAEMGEEVYRRLQNNEMAGDHKLLTSKEQIDAIRVELQQREADLHVIVHSATDRAAADDSGSP